MGRDKETIFDHSYAAENWHDPKKNSLQNKKLVSPTIILVLPEMLSSIIIALNKGIDIFPTSAPK